MYLRKLLIELSLIQPTKAQSARPAMLCSLAILGA
jgi:hypothetical protein